MFERTPGHFVCYAENQFRVVRKLKRKLDWNLGAAGGSLLSRRISLFYKTRRFHFDGLVLLAHCQAFIHHETQFTCREKFSLRKRESRNP